MIEWREFWRLVIPGQHKLLRENHYRVRYFVDELSAHFSHVRKFVYAKNVFSQFSIEYHSILYLISFECIMRMSGAVLHFSVWLDSAYGIIIFAFVGLIIHWIIYLCFWLIEWEGIHPSRTSFIYIWSHGKDGI